MLGLGGEIDRSVGAGSARAWVSAMRVVTSGWAPSRQGPIDTLLRSRGSVMAKTNAMLMVILSASTPAAIRPWDTEQVIADDQECRRIARQVAVVPACCGPAACHQLPRWRYVSRSSGSFAFECRLLGRVVGTLKYQIEAAYVMRAISTTPTSPEN